MSADAVILLAGKAINLGSRIYAAAHKFSRKRSPREHLEDVARWDRECMRLMSSQCCVCGRYVLAGTPCIGPPASQAARRKLEAMGPAR